MSVDYSDETLLEMYAPVLRFSAGENFFPMNVEDYVSNDTRLYQVENGRLGRVKVWEKLNGRDRLKDLGRIKGREAFLQHVVRNFRSDRLPQVLLMLAVAALVGVMIFSISGLSDAYTVMRLSIGDKLKIYLLGLFIVVWPFIDADGKVHLSLLLNLFGFFFFGTIFSIALGILAIAVISGFWVVYLVFRVYIHLQKNRVEDDVVGEKHMPWLHGISLFLVALASVVIGFGLSRVGYAIDWFRGDPLLIPTMLVIATSVFYFLLVVGNEIHIREKKRKKAPIKEYFYVLVLFGVLILEVIITFVWLDSNILAHVALLSIAGVSLLWYALDPLSITRPGLLRQENIRRPILGWDGRVLGFITGMLIIYFLMSALVYSFPYSQINDYIMAGVMHLLVSALMLAVTLGILGDKVISYFLDILSRLYNTDAVKARQKMQEAIRARSQLPDPKQCKPYWYYGRVSRQDEWIILQYNYFYAFNDFRSTAGGMNNHEGDWECVHVFLRDGEQADTCNCVGDLPHIRPFGVAYSQHHHGEFRFWQDVMKAKNRQGEATCHPLAYAALGSHANYPQPEIYPLSMQFSGTAQRLAARLEDLILSFRTRSRIMEKQIRNEEQTLQDYEDDTQKGFFARGGQPGGGAQEYAGGDGLRIGYGFDPKLDIYQDEIKVVIFPPSSVMRRESNFNGKPFNSNEDKFEDWAFEVINDETDWVKFKGLWGRRAQVEGEGGPQGPRWEGERERIRWRGSDGNALEWMYMLLLDIVNDGNKPSNLRKKALQELVSSD